MAYTINILGSSIDDHYKSHLLYKHHKWVLMTPLGSYLMTLDWHSKLLCHSLMTLEASFKIVICLQYMPHLSMFSNIKISLSTLGNSFRQGWSISEIRSLPLSCLVWPEKFLFVTNTLAFFTLPKKLLTLTAVFLIRRWVCGNLMIIKIS